MCAVINLSWAIHRETVPFVRGEIQYLDPRGASLLWFQFKMPPENIGTIFTALHTRIHTYTHRQTHAFGIACHLLLRKRGRQP